MTATGTHSRHELPREIAPGIFWLGQCLHQPYLDRTFHAYNSVYLVVGQRASLLVDGGFAVDLPVIERQLDQILRTGKPPVRYLFSSHAEMPHGAGFGRLMDRYPDSILCGDVVDYHLVFPQFADRLRPLAVGDSIDLGSSEFRVVPAIFKDLATSRWGFDTARRVLFTSDGMAYTHYHEAGQCAMSAEEASELDIETMTKLFAEFAFYWTRFVDLNRFIERMDRLIFDELSARIIAPAHGLPILNPSVTMGKVWEGLRSAVKGIPPI